MRRARVAVILVVGALAFILPATARAGDPPAMAFSPTFWATAVHSGTSTTRDFTLTNSGGNATGALTLTISLSGPFTISVDGCTGVSLGPGKSCKVTVQYAPVTAGITRAELTARSKKYGFSAASLFGDSWLTGEEACDQLDGVYGIDDQVHYSDASVNWTCNDWVAASNAGPLLADACQHTPPRLDRVHLPHRCGSRRRNLLRSIHLAPRGQRLRARHAEGPPRGGLVRKFLSPKSFRMNKPKTAAVAEPTISESGGVRRTK